MIQVTVEKAESDCAEYRAYLKEVLPDFSKATPIDKIKSFKEKFGYEILLFKNGNMKIIQ